MESSKYQCFAEDFRQICGTSCNRLAYEHQQTDVEYKARAKASEELCKLIEEKLGADYKLINKFDAAKNHQMTFDHEFIYQQGFQDCVYLLRWMGLL